MCSMHNGTSPMLQQMIYCAIGYSLLPVEAFGAKKLEILGHSPSETPQEHTNFYRIKYGNRKHCIKITEKYLNVRIKITNIKIMIMSSE